MPQNLVTIPKLETQWKILYDVKRTEYLQVENPRKIYATLSIYVGRDAVVRASVSPPQILLGGYLQGDAQQVAAGDQVPKVGEWTRIEIGHEEEDGKYFLSFAVEGGELEKKEATDPEFGEMTDVTIDIEEHRIQPGFIRRLLVLQKE